ncbi:MAG TPA: VTT domain-containing protein [Spirochaetia bacterium]|nr:VTT domain-containing protein [Spirochaetia bacterium]
MIKKISKNIRKIFIVLLTFGLPIALIIVFRNDIKNIEKIIPSTGILGPLLSILLMGILSATPIPTDPIVILNGAIFGPWIGILISWMGNNLASIIEYYIGRGICQITDFEKNKKRLPFGLSNFSPDSVWFLFFGRFIPQFGGKIVSLTGGFYHVPLTRYLWTAFLSNLLGSIILSYGGYSLLHSIF